MSTKGDFLWDVLIRSPFRNWREQVVVFVLLGLVAGLGILTPYFLTLENLLNIGRQSAVVTLLGVGLTFTIISGEIDISIGGTMVLSAVHASMVIDAGFGMIGGVAAGLATGIIVGAANGLIIIKFSVPSFLVTLGMLGVLRGCAYVVSGNTPILVNDPAFEAVFGGAIGPLPNILLWTGGTALAAHIALSYTQFGRHVYTTGDSAEAARLTGIRTGRVKFLTLTTSGFIAGLAGLLLIARLSAARPSMSLGIELAVVAAVIIGGTSLFGGKGWILGTIIGSLLMSVIDNALILNGFGSSYQQLIRGLVIILAVALRRQSKESGWL